MVVYCISIIIDSSMCKKKKKRKKEKKKKNIVYIFHCIILLKACVCIRHIVTPSIYDYESSYVSSFLS